MIQPVYHHPDQIQEPRIQVDAAELESYRDWLTRRNAARNRIRRLSRRETQVVDLVSQGLANKSIALELEISVKTIEKHRANAVRKLGVASTAELVRLAVLADHEPTPVRVVHSHSGVDSRETESSYSLM